jgi:citrate synthase
MGAPADNHHTDKNHLSSKEVADLLRIKPQTLYAYVSRGWIRSIGKDKRRGFLYSRDDVERLRARGHARADGGLLKRGAPRWSEPIVQSAITKITPEGPEYRGRPALALARRGHRFENVAELLWSGAWVEEASAWRMPVPPAPMDRLMGAMGADLDTPDAVKPLSALVMALAMRANGSDDLRDGNTVLAARELLSSMPGCLGYLGKARRYAPGEAGASLPAAVLAAGGVEPSPAAMQAVNAAFVLLADHELTPQTFAARLAASSGANLYNCVLSALAVHSGSRIRRSCDRVEDLLGSARDAKAFRARFAELASSVSSVPGFNHPLYPGGDPRAAFLVEQARALAGNRKFRFGDLLDEAFREFGARPGVEAGLVALCHALRLPYRSAGAILAIARCSGWIAHVIEQRLAGMMLRPRARYMG